MKRPALIKQLLFGALVVAGMNLCTSCDSCSRNGSNTEGVNDANDANGDTRGSESPADNEDSGSTEGTGTSSGTPSDRNTSAASGNIPASGPGNASANTTGRQLSEQEITNRVENSDPGRVDKNGNPIRSSGASGTGTGTGTGSTGNNSRVTTAEAQRN